VEIAGTVLITGWMPCLMTISVNIEDFAKTAKSVARELIPFWRFEPVRVDPS